MRTNRASKALGLALAGSVAITGCAGTPASQATQAARPLTLDQVSAMPLQDCDGMKVLPCVTYSQTEQYWRNAQGVRAPFTDDAQATVTACITDVQVAPCWGEPGVTGGVAYVIDSRGVIDYPAGS